MLIPLNMIPCDMSAGPLSAKIRLLERSAEGARTATFSSAWTGMLIASPRNRESLSVIKDLEETHSPGVYLLTGEDPELGSRPKMYIGESDKLWDRIYQHDRGNKDFWNSIYGVVSKSRDSELNKTNILYLESLAISKAKEIHRADVVNKTAPSPPQIGDIERDEMNHFYQMMTHTLPLVGCNFLTPTRPVAATVPTGHSDDLVGLDEVFRLKMRNGVEARAIQKGSEFIVLKGSSASMDDGKSWVNARRFRDNLIQEGSLVVDGDRYRFTRDVPFGSPSAAGCVVRALQTNGRTAWVESESGKRYVEIYGRVHENSGEDISYVHEIETVIDDQDEVSASDVTQAVIEKLNLTRMGNKGSFRWFKTPEGELIHLKFSKYHEKNKYFWYGITTASLKFSEEYGITKFCFIQGDEGFIIIDIEEVKEYTKGAKTSYDYTSGGIRHYHVFARVFPEPALFHNAGRGSFPMADRFTPL